MALQCDEMEADRKSNKRLGSLEKKGTEGKRKRLVNDLLNESLLQESFIKEIGDVYKYVTKIALSRVRSCFLTTHLLWSKLVKIAT